MPWINLKIDLCSHFYFFFSQVVPSTSKSLWFFVTKKISGHFVTHFQFFVTLSFGVVLQAFMDQFLLTTNLATTEWTRKWRHRGKHTKMEQN